MKVPFEMETPLSSDVCDVIGCGDSEAPFSLVKDENETRTCRRCAQELIAVSGWRLLTVGSRMAEVQAATPG